MSIKKVKEQHKTVWYKDGKVHRDDGPAVIWNSGNKEWFQNGKLHRDEGPSIEYDSITMWHQYGELHREDGFAVDYGNGAGEFYLRNKHISEVKTLEDFLNFVKFKAFW